MKETIYFYITGDGSFHFSNGVDKPELRAGEYFRVLRKLGYPTEQLHLDNPEHFELIKAKFRSENYWIGRTWVEEYNND